MVARIVIAGEAQCHVFAEMCLIADHLAQNLPNFCYERIEKPIAEWKGKAVLQCGTKTYHTNHTSYYHIILILLHTNIINVKAWLCKINQKNKWHHGECPLIWKELLHKGSKPYYIGSASEFLDYCYSYYHFDKFVASEKFKGLIKNYKQYQNNIKENDKVISEKMLSAELVKHPPKTSFTVCISGVGCPLTMYIISGLLDMNMHNKCIGRIYIYDKKCSKEFMESVENDCNYVATSQSGRVVRYVEKIGSVLTHSDMLIILDHVPFNPELSIGGWLHDNKKIMLDIALTINASASRKMYILIPNVGPACYNATILMNSVTNMEKRNIVVATSNLGLEITPLAAEIADVPMRNMFCSPVWGFVGINHLVDIRTTIHKYNKFEPYDRYTKVKNSSLSIGHVTPQMRTMEYLVQFDDTLWVKAAEIKTKITETLPLSKAVAVLDIVKLWLIDPNPNYIVNLGILCNGTFGLTFDGSFSQPSRFIDGQWFPAKDYMLPKDPQMKINYLEDIARKMMTLKKKELPKVVPYCPCSCKPTHFKKKGIL